MPEFQIGERRVGDDAPAYFVADMAKRGTIYDRNGAPLAESVEVPSISVDAVEMLRGIDPKYLPMKIQQYSARVAEALNMPVEEVADKLTRDR